MLGDVRKELEHEEATDTAAQAARLRVLLQEAGEGSSELPRAHILISRMFGDVKAHLEAVASIVTRGLGGKYKGWLRAIPSDVAAVIAIRECIKLCTSSTHTTHVHVQDLTNAIGKLYELEARIRQAEAVNPMYMQRIHDQMKENATTNRGHIRKVYGFAVEQIMKGEIEFDLTKSDMMHIGKFGVDACLEAGLIEQVRGTCKAGVMVEYRLNPDIEEFLTGYTENDVRNVIAKDDMRMYCPPEPWTNVHDGGYLTARRKAAAPLLGLRGIRKSERQRVAAEFTAERMPKVFSAGNYMQGTAFTVHAATRQAIQKVWAAGGGVLGVPKTKAPERPEFPFNPEWLKEHATEDELSAFHVWKRSVVWHYKAIREWRGKCREIAGFFKCSNDVSEPIWFPMYFDRRGRWYYRGTPNPQGSDLSKSVLHFWNKLPLGPDGVYWLKVHIANSLGYDKERFADRARWVDQQWPTLERALDAPEDHAEVFGKDAPWCVFAAAWELREAYRSGNPATYCTGIPIHMDATCSGLQHFSAILRDPVGGQYVNLTDEAKCGPKQDIYARVSDNAMAVIRQDMEDSDEKIARVATWWANVGIPRSLAKKPVMTYVYGATLRGTYEFIEEYVLREMGLTFPEDDHKHTYSLYAARKLFQGIAATVPSAKSAMDWLRDVARQQPNGKRMEWRTPVGFLVQHDYQDHKDNRVKLNSCGVTHVLVREFTEDTKAHAMQNAISPNFVHALDASHLTITANKMQENGAELVAIHDSFGTHPCNVELMHRCVREGFVELYDKRNIFGEFLWDVGGVGAPPMRGNLEVRDVLESEFFFC